MLAMTRRRSALVLLSLAGVLVLYLNHPGVDGWWTSLQQPGDQRMCDCERCVLEGDAWFTANFDKTINPFLTQKSNISAQNYLWWKSLQKDPTDLETFRGVVDQVFSLFPEARGYGPPAAPQRCSTCSVVGNSGNMRGSHSGALIDLSDAVFRMNGAPTKGFEEDVGKKTSFHMMYPESAVDLDNSTHLILVPFKTQDLQWLISAFTTGAIKHTYKPVKATIKAHRDLVRILNPEFIKYVFEIWLGSEGRYPSTGFLGLMLAMHICDEVNVFGFGADQDGNWRHYWEELHDKKLGTGVHGGKKEFELIQKFAAKGKISFFPGH